jgi:hypothetical protein
MYVYTYTYIRRGDALQGLVLLVWLVRCHAFNSTFKALLFNCFSSMICSLHLSKEETKAPFSILCTTFKAFFFICFSSMI